MASYKTFRLDILLAMALAFISPLSQVAAQTANPFETKQLSAIARVLGDAVQDKGDPANTPLALVTNDLSPFWTAGQIGSQRAASELGVPVVLNAPIKPGDKAAQQKIISTFIEDGYKGIAFSAIDPISIEPIINDGIAKNIHFMTFDSDAPNTNRLLYLGTDNYNAGVAAGNALIQALGSDGGKVVGLVGALTAQNAVDRIRGIKDAIKDTKITLETVLVDDLDPLVAEHNAEQAISNYPDLVAFITLYSYDGPAAGKALKIMKKTGDIKVVAFDLAPETIALLKEGVVSAAIGQRPYFMGYLSVYILYAVSTLGPEQTMTLLAPYLSGDKKDFIDTGVDIVTKDNMPLYSDYLNSIGIKSQ